MSKQAVPETNTGTTSGAFPTEGELDDSDDDALELYDVPQSVSSEVRTILASHDENGLISKQIVECLQKDGLSLDTLTSFDDHSLKQMIDSWHLNTYNKKPFLISGLFIAGIKQRRRAAALNQNCAQISQMSHISHASQVFQPPLQMSLSINSASSVSAAPAGAAPAGAHAPLDISDVTNLSGARGIGANNPNNPNIPYAAYNANIANIMNIPDTVTPGSVATPGAPTPGSFGSAASSVSNSNPLLANDDNNMSSNISYKVGSVSTNGSPFIQQTPAVLSDAEMERFVELGTLENEVIDKLIRKFENDEKEQELRRSSLLDLYNKQIESVFDGLINKLVATKYTMCTRLQEVFEWKDNKHQEYLLNLRQIKSEIQAVKKQYNLNFEQFPDDLDERRRRNVAIIDATLAKHKKFSNVLNAQLVDELDVANIINYECEVQFAASAITGIESLIDDVCNVPQVTDVARRHRQSDADAVQQGQQGQQQQRRDRILSKINNNNNDGAGGSMDKIDENGSPSSSGVVQNSGQVDSLLSNAKISLNLQKTFKTTVIDAETVWDASVTHTYEILILEQGGMLTVPPWGRKKAQSSFSLFGSNSPSQSKNVKNGKNGKNGKNVNKNVKKMKNSKNNANIADDAEGSLDGGVLRLECYELVLRGGSLINLTGKGFSGGKAGGFQGHSWRNSGRDTKKSKKCNAGGGGSGAGGGYASKGRGSKYNAQGGECYGDDELSTLYLGSGGGASVNQAGSNGGGALLVHAKHRIVVERGAQIRCDGGNVNDSYATGCGSGGSVFLMAPLIVNQGIISAVGGVNRSGNALGSVGAGGNGRIRIDCKKENENFATQNGGVIQPCIGYMQYVEE